MLVDWVTFCGEPDLIASNPPVYWVWDSGMPIRANWVSFFDAEPGASRAISYLGG